MGLKPRGAQRRRAQLLELARFLTPRSEPIAEMIRLAFDEPLTYVTKHGEERSLDEDDASDPLALAWTALLDGLEAADRVGDIDWKTECDTLMWVLDRIAGDIDWSWTSPLDLDDVSTLEFLELTGRHLAARGRLLVSLETGTDHYALVTIDKQDSKELTRLLRSVSRGRYIFRGRQSLESMRKERKSRRR
jgi:hypothetical protein